MSASRNLNTIKDLLQEIIDRVQHDEEIQYDDVAFEFKKIDVLHRPHKRKLGRYLDDIYIGLYKCKGNVSDVVPEIKTMLQVVAGSCR